MRPNRLSTRYFNLLKIRYKIIGDICKPFFLHVALYSVPFISKLQHNNIEKKNCIGFSTITLMRTTNYIGCIKITFIRTTNSIDCITIRLIKKQQQRKQQKQQHNNENNNNKTKTTTTKQHRKHPVILDQIPFIVSTHTHRNVFLNLIKPNQIWIALLHNSLLI